MKAKKVLFTTSGVLKIVVSAISLLFFLLIILLCRVVVEAMVSNEETMAEFLASVGEMDTSNLSQMSVEEFQNYLISSLNSFCWIVIFMSISGIVLGIFNVIFAKKYDPMLMGKKGKKIIFTICSLIFYPGLITNILTIIALFLKDNIPSEAMSAETGTINSANGGNI